MTFLHINLWINIKKHVTESTFFIHWIFGIMPYYSHFSLALSLSLASSFFFSSSDRSCPIWRDKYGVRNIDRRLALTKINEHLDYHTAFVYNIHQLTHFWLFILIYRHHNCLFLVTLYRFTSFVQLNTWTISMLLV